MNLGPLTAVQLQGLFEDLSRELKVRGERAQLYVVGGAAIALAHDDRRVTRDVDALFAPAPVVRLAAEAVAERHGLDADWLNDAAKGYLPVGEGVARTVFESDTLLVQTASPEDLLAMKLLAVRDERDLDDAALLFNEAGYTETQEGLDLLARSYPANLLEVKHRYLTMDVAERASALRNSSRRIVKSSLDERLE